MPSSSARCAQLPRAADKVPFYAALKKFRDYLNGLITEIDESEMVFSEPRVKSFYEAEPKMDVVFAPELTDIGGVDALKNADGVATPCKKKRGRPKKIKVEGETPPKPVRKVQVNNNCDFPKKKRGRPKKVKLEEMAGMETTNLGQMYQNSSPLQSPGNFYSQTPPNTLNSMYPAPQPLPYSSPRPHSDLSSEISAAISSDHLGSPGSPSLGPPDFDPPNNMSQEEVEGRLSPERSNEEAAQAHCSYGFGVEENRFGQARQQDLAAKSLSGLESLVDQIPSITEGEGQIQEVQDFSHHQFESFRSSPVSYDYHGSNNGYPLYPTWGGHYDVPLPYAHVPYPQTYPSGFHPNPTYPYYGYQHGGSSYPPYLGGFWFYWCFQCRVPVLCVRFSACWRPERAFGCSHRVFGDIFSSTSSIFLNCFVLSIFSKN